jgi:hypothetical protein
MNKKSWCRSGRDRTRQSLAVAKRHGMSVKQAIAEAITEDVAFWRQKGPYPSGPDTAESTVETAPYIYGGTDRTLGATAHLPPV